MKASSTIVVESSGTLTLKGAQTRLNGGTWPLATVGNAVGNGQILTEDRRSLLRKYIIFLQDHHGQGNWGGFFHYVASPAFQAYTGRRKARLNLARGSDDSSRRWLAAPHLSPIERRPR